MASVCEDGQRLVFRGDKGGSGSGARTDREVLLVSSQRPLRGFITADGSRVVFLVFASKGRSSGAVDGWQARKICVDCSDIYLEARSRDKTRVLYEAGIPPRFSSSISDGREETCASASPNRLWNAGFSPDDRWITVTLKAKAVLVSRFRRSETGRYQRHTSGFASRVANTGMTSHAGRLTGPSLLHIPA